MNRAYSFESSIGPLDVSSSSSAKSTPQKLSENTNAQYQLPESANNRTGRWQPSELVNLKLAMGVFGDQSWRKIQRFLV